MTTFKFVFLAVTLSYTFASQAFVITDVISVDKPLASGGYSFDFDLTKHGYNHLTDTINFVELSYDFSKMIDPGDDYDNMDTLETIQLNSYLFDGRINFYDINPGVLQQRLSWTKDESYCQHENYHTGECELNLDLNGTAREFLSVYNGDIWLSDVKFSVDVTRVGVPEPSSLILLVLGLFSLFAARVRSTASKPG